jgi:hypothetical protein
MAGIFHYSFENAGAILRRKFRSPEMKIAGKGSAARSPTCAVSLDKKIKK